MHPRKLQALVLRLVGTMEFFAFGSAVMPRSWMEMGHRWLGMGEMPQGAVVDFMIRQASFSYGLHGIALWFIAFDVVRYRPLVILSGIGYFLAGPAFYLIDAVAGMPMIWIAGNGTSCLLIGVLLLGLEWCAMRHESITNIP